MAISFDRLKVLNPSPIARRLLWHVLSIGLVSRDEPEEHAGMDKAGFFLFRVRTGLCVLEVPGDRFELGASPQFCLLDLARSRRYVPVDGSRVETLGVRFSGPGIDGWREEVLRGRAALVLAGPADVVRLRATMGELVRLARRATPASEWRMNELVTSLLGVLLASQDVLQRGGAEPRSPASRVVEAVQANPLRAWRADELAAMAGIGYSSLRQQFKAAQGRTLHEFLQQTRLEQARTRLSDMRLSVKAIALQLNFSSEFYFSRWFHHATGMSPSRFRAMLRG